MNNAPPSRRYTLALIGAVTWTALVLGLYYWAHKPLTPALARALGGALLDLALAAALVMVGGGLGRRLLRPLDLGTWSVPERGAAAGLIGLGALSLLIMALGALTLHPLAVGGLIGLTAALTRRDLIGWVRDWITWARQGVGGDGWTRLVAGTVLALVGAALTLSVLPPAKWDVLTYHLVGPEMYTRHGRFYAALHNHFLGFPQLVETLYTAQLALTGRLTGAGPLHGLIGGLALLMTGGYTARHAGRAAGWLAAAALLVSSTLWLEMTFAYVDLMLVGLAAVALAVFEAWEAVRADSLTPPPSPPHVAGAHGEGRDLARQARQGPASLFSALWGGRERGLLFLLGALAGLAQGVKYTAFWIGIAFGLLVLWHSRRDGPRALIGRVLIFGGTALAVGLPWLVRNAIWYDNPVYPFVFEAGDMNALRQDWYRQPGSGLLHTANAWQIPVLPLAVTIFGVENAGLYAADVGPLFALLVPLIGLAWGRLSVTERGAAGRALAAAALMTLGWMVLAALGSYINAQVRLVLYVLPLLAVPAAIALEGLGRLPSRPLNLGFVIRAIVMLVLVFTLVDRARLVITGGIHAYFSGEDTYRADYLRDRLGWHYAALETVNALPAGTHVWFLWEPRTLYCDDQRITCRPDSLMDAWYAARRAVGDGSPAAIAARWQAEGVDMLLVYEFGRTYEQENQDLYDPADWAAWERFVADHLVEWWRGGSAEDDIQYILYTWRTPRR